MPIVQRVYTSTSLEPFVRLEFVDLTFGILSGKIREIKLIFLFK